MKNQKMLLIAIPVVIILLLIVGGVVLGKSLFRNTDNAKATPAPRPVEQVNTIPVSERPYAIMTPSTDGRNLNLTIVDVKKTAKDVEYELEYQTGDLLQGAFGKASLASLPVEKEILLGSCSAGGKCTYHENVTGGSLLLRFLGGEKYVLKNDWSFHQNKDKAVSFSSRDGKFIVESPAFAKVGYSLILNSPGLPENPEQAVISNAYAPSFSTEVTGEVSITLRLNEDKPATLLGWDGEAWKTVKSKTADKTVTATKAPLYDVYVAVEELAE